MSVIDMPRLFQLYAINTSISVMYAHHYCLSPTYSRLSMMKFGDGKEGTEGREAPNMTHGG